ncbi:MAG: spermidine synthase [Planctomycetota bacterium]
MAGARVQSDLWVSEYVTPYDVYLHGVTRIIAAARTQYQDMQIVETGVYGKALVLDGKWQSCTGEEFIYHETLVHAPCLVHGRPKRVLVLGGGEGATVREALRWNSVERVTMVDIDGEVVEACKTHLPEMHQGAFDDPRTELVIGDAIDFVERAEPEWDVIISDLSDPIEEGPSFALFTREFFEKAQRALAPGGVFCVQSGSVACGELDIHARLSRTLAAVFDHRASCTMPTATYAAPWSIIISRDGEPIDRMPDPERVDSTLTEQTRGKLGFLDGRTVLGLYQTPLYLRRAIEAERQVYSIAEPPKFFGQGIAADR